MHVGFSPQENTRSLQEGKRLLTKSVRRACGSAAAAPPGRGRPAFRAARPGARVPHLSLPNLSRRRTWRPCLRPPEGHPHPGPRRVLPGSSPFAFRSPTRQKFQLGSTPRLTSDARRLGAAPIGYASALGGDDLRETAHDEPCVSKLIGSRDLVPSLLGQGNFRSAKPAAFSGKRGALWRPPAPRSGSVAVRYFPPESELGSEHTGDHVTPSGACFSLLPHVLQALNEESAHITV